MYKPEEDLAVLGPEHFVLPALLLLSGLLAATLTFIAEIYKQGQMPIGPGTGMHATANEKDFSNCLLLTQVKTRDATASKKGKKRKA